jgi:hypothetical protein
MERIMGTVSRANDTGFQLAARDGWLNISKYGDGVEVPPVGALVAVELDKSGFVRRVDVETAPAVETPALADRETRINRLAVLNTATAILGADPSYPVDAAEVAKLAARLEAWAIRAAS